MRVKWNVGLLLALVAGLVVGLCVSSPRIPAALGAEQAAQAEHHGFPRYDVVQTEGHNLIVTDHQNNTLYFYTIDKDKEIGSDLRLRGSLDLTQVGKDVIRLKSAKYDK
jgi:hypothetical protein